MRALQGSMAREEGLEDSREEGLEDSREEGRLVATGGLKQMRIQSEGTGKPRPAPHHPLPVLLL